MPKLAVHPPEWIDAAPTVAQSSVDIEAPAAAVWARIADHESWPTWFDDIKKIEIVGTGEGVGGGRRVHIGFLTVDEEFTAWDVDEHFAFAVTKTAVPVLRAMIESVRIEPNDDGCTVTYRQGLEGRRGLGWLIDRLGRQLQGQTAAALSNLKTAVESESA